MEFWQSRQKFFNRSPKNIDDYINLFQQNFLAEYSSGKAECSFDNPAEFFQPKPEERSWYDQNFLRKVSSQNFFLEKRNPILTILLKIIPQKPEQNLWTYSFFQTKFSPWIFIWKYIMHFWPSRQKFFNRSPKSNDEYMNFFQQYFSRKVFFRKNWQSCCKISTRSSKNIYEPIVFFSNKSFLRKYSSGIADCNFDNLAAKFWPEARRKVTNL